MKNKIEDLRNHLFAELERLGEEGLQGEALDAEIKRARAISNVAGRVVDSAKAETDFLRITGAESGTGFIPEGEAALNGSGIHPQRGLPRN